jgi:very-short-patch-repair endonuclease
MLLTITTTHSPAIDLGFLLHKNPARPQVFDLSFGRAHVLYSETGDERCTAALLLEVDPVGLVRNRRGPAGEGFSLEQYVNDRPYVASSFLSVAISQVFGSAWHYRSRHQSLIAPANRFSYNDRLVLFPSSLDTHPELGVRHTYVQGAITTTGNVVNAKEAGALVDRLLVLARQQQTRPAHQRLTIGVVAMNKSQMDYIQDLIDVRREEDSFADRAIASLEENSAEPLFVKNLENIQGDQRDVILISYTYGANTPGGTPAQRFGPLGLDGGERRFNVLITRSKLRMEIFASLRSPQILTEGKKLGVVHFQGFLAFAEGGTLKDGGVRITRSAGSPFEEHVIAALRDDGYEVESKVGVAGYFIDFAVRNPYDRSQFVLGIECDGATYHSSKAARDRDRLREMVLKDRGWKLYRIWSTDWFTNHPLPRRTYWYTLRELAWRRKHK